MNPPDSKAENQKISTTPGSDMRDEMISGCVGAFGPGSGGGLLNMTEGRSVVCLMWRLHVFSSCCGRECCQRTGVPDSTHMWTHLF